MSASGLNVYSRVTFEKNRHTRTSYTVENTVRHSNGGSSEVAQEVKVLPTELTAWVPSLRSTGSR